MTTGEPVGAPVPGRPRLLVGPASAAVHDGSGDLHLERECRGAAMEWGGVYGQLVRLTEGWTVRIAVGETIAPLSAAPATASGDDHRWRTRHRVSGLDVAQELSIVAHPPGVHRRLRLGAAGGGPVEAAVVSSFAPHLLPVLVEGIRPVDFHVRTTDRGLIVRHGGYALGLRSEPLADQLYLNRASWRGGRWDGPVRQVASEYRLRCLPGEGTQLDLFLYGGLEREFGAWDASVEAALHDPDSAVRAADAADAAWGASLPILSFPDAPWLTAAYARAVRGLRRLYSSPGDGMTGLVAGYPWYSALWGRDLAWMIPAVLWLGDFDWAGRSIDTLLRFQAPSDLPAFGAEAGELPMQLAPGPVLIYGTSDTTWHAPTLVLRYLRHGGDPAAEPRWREPLRRVLAWGDRRVDPATGLVRNGGEVAEIATTTAALTRVRYGIDAPDTTIWDSADRRDHAIDLQALAYEAWRAAAELGPGSAAGRDAVALRARATRLASEVRARFPTPDGSYLGDTLRHGALVATVRPNALRAVSAGLVDGALARRVVARAAASDLTTPWGVRTLSDRDPAYDPVAYHGGQVWSIATAWAADAALGVGEVERGVGYLRTLADRFEAEDGDANECYRGDRPEPFDSCFLLGFSVGPFLTVLFERLWGLSVDARRSRLGVAPTFPANWSAASLDRLRVGSGHLSLAWTPGRLDVRWSGPGTWTVETPTGSVPAPPGAPVVVPLPTGRGGTAPRRDDGGPGSATI